MACYLENAYYLLKLRFFLIKSIILLVIKINSIFSLYRKEETLESKKREIISQLIVFLFFCVIGWKGKKLDDSDIINPFIISLLISCNKL